MKIDRIDTAYYRFPPHRRIVDAIQEVECLEVIAATVHTDSGDEGFGFTYTIGRGGRATKVMLDTEVVPLVLGEDPRDTQRLWERMWWGLHWVGRHGVTLLASSAIDIALWDLKARQAGQPLFRFLGAARDRTPVYNTDCGWLNHGVEEMVREAAGCVERGSPGVKIKVGKESRLEDLARVRAVRRAVGDDVKLMVDANLRWTASEAMARCRLLEDLDLFWMEEPLDADDVLGHEQLSRHTSIPIALGENLFNRHVFREYLARGAAGILQPDVGRVGVTEWLRIAALAHSFNASVSPHLMMEVHVHLVCATPNALFVEQVPMLERFLQHPLRIEGGYAFPPERPGHGVAFDQDKVSGYCLEKSSWT